VLKEWHNVVLIVNPVVDLVIHQNQVDADVQIIQAA